MIAWLLLYFRGGNFFQKSGFKEEDFTNSGQGNVDPAKVRRQWAEDEGPALTGDPAGAQDNQVSSSGEEPEPRGPQGAPPGAFLGATLRPAASPSPWLSLGSKAEGFTLLETRGVCARAREPREPSGCCQTGRSLQGGPAVRFSCPLANTGHAAPHPPRFPGKSVSRVKNTNI